MPSVYSDMFILRLRDFKYIKLTARKQDNTQASQAYFVLKIQLQLSKDHHKQDSHCCDGEQRKQIVRIVLNEI